MHGTLYEPTLSGARGGKSARGAGGRGGGFVKLTVGETFTLDGSIKADAEDMPAAGGGSGGSVWVTCKNMVGHTSGLISAVGADVTFEAGPGAGGRIAVYAEEIWNTFEGTMSATGGTATTDENRGGGPGSVYSKETYSSIHSHDKLDIDNSDHPWTTYFTLAEVDADGDKVVDYAFNEIHMHRHTALRVLPTTGPEASLKVESVVGDRTGLIHVYKGQSVEVDVIANVETITRTPFNVRVDDDGTIELGTTTYIVGATNEGRALELNGHLKNIVNLKILSKRQVLFGQNASVSYTDKDTGNVVETDPGVFEFGQFELG
eukprot:gene1837-20604_t